MDRREFTVEAARLLLGGAVIAISGCAGGGSSSPTASSAPVPDRTGVVNSNHGHGVTISSAQLTSGDGVQLDIRGTSGHTHSVMLTADEVRNIRYGAYVVKESTGSSHTHTVAFNGW
jgi:hypothetical protein